ncbi:hypothetical protein VN97_g9684 [Penicillium thymicola]|uniref:Uncharacterized protein n=1 Tax=Penicillium thymicola TaxID=293382 RepID=A0AAI9X4Z8_PENTH|nr:hypothetical protein VN97_g9684 [Penicillium thymicola]
MCIYWYTTQEFLAGHMKFDPRSARHADLDEKTIWDCTQSECYRAFTQSRSEKKLDPKDDPSDFSLKDMLWHS